nr:hypothetical protein [uncultured Bacillus sp.]
MKMDDRKEIHTDDPAFDPFTEFMFGKGKGHYDKKDDKGKKSDNDWLIGRKRSHSPHRSDKSGLYIGDIPLMEYLNQIDMDKLAGNVDTLMTTVEQFKPLIQEITPFIKKWIK